MLDADLTGVQGTTSDFRLMMLLIFYSRHAKTPPVWEALCLHSAARFIRGSILSQTLIPPVAKEVGCREFELIVVLHKIHAHH